MTTKPLFEILFQPGEAIEVRVVAPWCGSGFFDNANDLGAALSELDGLKPEAVYCSLNPVTAEAFERSPNQFQRARRGVKLACSGADISRRAWILIDFDPIRRDPVLGTKVSSTDAEKNLALTKMRLVRDYLLSEGAPPMVEADSGNGVHLLLPCDLPADKDSGRLVRGCLEFLSAKFTDAEVKVDTVNWNADRITKAYGTMTRKGPDTPERPHRRSGIISVPPSTSPVNRELLERMQLKPLPKATEAEAIAGWVERAEKSIAELREWSQTVPDFPAIQRVKREADKIIAIPECCYLNPDHSGSSAGIVFHSDGGIGNVCKHESCNKPFPAWWKLVEERYATKLPLVQEVLIRIGVPKPRAASWSLENYSGIRIEEVPWIFRNLLARGMPTALVGEPGQGKSLTTNELAARITTARGFPDGQEALIPASSVLMLNTEDHAGNTIKPRFLAAGGDASRLYQLRLPEGQGFYVDNEDDVRRLAQQLTAHPDIKLIVIDPIAEHALSTYEQDIRRGVANFRALLADRGVSLIYVSHFSKMQRQNLGSAMDKISGAKAWTGLPRFVWAVMRNPVADEAGLHRHHLVCAKNNLASGSVVSYDFLIESKTSNSAKGGLIVGGPPVIKWLGESEVTMDSLLTQPRHPKEQPLLEEIATQIEAELQKRDRPAADIIATLVRAGYAKRSIERAKALIILTGVMDKPVNRDGSWYWRLAKQKK